MKAGCFVWIVCALTALLSGACAHPGNPDWQLSPEASDLVFDDLAHSWDEAIPLGNATLGSLVWERDSMVRMSLDRVDLWDLRPTDSLSGANYRFSWVKEHIASGNYLPVQQKFDWPYDANPAPSKIPGAAIEFPSLGRVSEVRLYLHNALCEVRWENGAVMHCFVHADRPAGWFVIENLPAPLTPAIVPPVYGRSFTDDTDPVVGQDLSRLGYRQGTLRTKEGESTYHQEGWGGFHYDVALCWKNTAGRCEGVWSITSSLVPEQASDQVAAARRRGLSRDYAEHLNWWKNYWSRSSVSLPDSVLQREYDNDMYKFGSVARADSYPISLQAVWTADNGKLPPWKGDFHHDLNTELSYWPAYAGNHLEEGYGYLNTLWNQRDVYRKYTRQYFEKEGLAIPGVCTLQGEAMGGWIQYAMSQTVAAWLSHHFYLHWKYSADDDFLRERGYPFVSEAALFLERQTELGADGVRRLPYSSSPEMFDNSLQAWFKTMTNYDLALTSSLFKEASEMAAALGRDDESAHWQQLRSQLPDYALDADGALCIAEGFPYESSHRHFSHAMAIHPLGLLNWENGGRERAIIEATVAKLEACGPRWWTGYSYAWFANMKARIHDGEGAARALRDFAECFCLPNTFHANGDQSGRGKSDYDYRPFTLEGNFAFAAGVQEMLLQSHTGIIRLFPAVPDSWQNVSFRNLRAQGAFLVSAEKRDGRIVSVEIRSEKGGELQLCSPFDGRIVRMQTSPNQIIRLPEDPQPPTDERR